MRGLKAVRLHSLGCILVNVKSVGHGIGTALLGLTGCLSVVVFVLLLPSCAPTQSAASTKAGQQNTTHSEKTVTAISKESSPRTIEKDGPGVGQAQSLTFRLVSGDRVEGVVTLTSGTGETSGVIATVKDPFGNVLAQSATKQELRLSGGGLESVGRTYYVSVTVSTQTYPWQFAFIAAASGDYSLEANPYGPNNESTVHLKVTINP